MVDLFLSAQGYACCHVVSRPRRAALSPSLTCHFTWCGGARDTISLSVSAPMQMLVFVATMPLPPVTYVLVLYQSSTSAAGPTSQLFLCSNGEHASKKQGFGIP